MGILVAILVAAWVSAVRAEDCETDQDTVADLSGVLAEVGDAIAAEATEAWMGLDADAFAAQGLSKEVFSKALSAHRTAWERGNSRETTLSVIDFSLASTERRLWVIDLAAQRVLFREYVAHGQNTGGNYAEHFSNRDESHQSSLGLMKTGATYSGKHGYSLRLEGLEDGFNDNAFDRAIVMHGASYATESFIGQAGRLGRSWGCPALDPAVSADVIDTIKGGTLLFVYFPESTWLEASEYLNPES